LSQKKLADGGGDFDFLLLVHRFIKLTFFSLTSFFSLADLSFVAELAGTGMLFDGPDSIGFGGVFRVAATRTGCHCGDGVEAFEEMCVGDAAWVGDETPSSRDLWGGPMLLAQSKKLVGLELAGSATGLGFA